MDNFLEKFGDAYNPREFAVIDVPFAVKPAARPRLGKNGRAYNPSSYTQAKETFKDYLEMAFLDAPDLMATLPLPCCEVRVYFIGWAQLGKSGSGDGDNMMKTVLDSLVQVGAIADDRLARVPRASWQFVPCGSPPITRIVLLELDYAVRPRRRC